MNNTFREKSHFQENSNSFACENLKRWLLKNRCVAIRFQRLVRFD